MNNFTRIIALGLLFCGVVSDLRAQRNFDNINIEVVPVADGVYMLRGAGGNIGVSIGDDGLFMVDDQFAPLSDRIQATIATITDMPVHFVINTHHHGDHTGGNENFGAAGAHIVAHENVRTRLLAQRLEGSLSDKVLPVITFSTDLDFHWNGQQIRVMHFPSNGAHTDGDAVVHFTGSNVVHMGDLFFNGMYPFIDVNSGGDAWGLLSVVSRVISLIDDDTRVIPGHGPLSDKAALVAYRDMLNDITTKVNRGVRAGLSLETIIAQKPTQQYDEVWTGGFVTPDRLVTTIYQSIRR